MTRRSQTKPATSAAALVAGTSQGDAAGQAASANAVGQTDLQSAQPIDSVSTSNGGEVADQAASNTTVLAASTELTGHDAQLDEPEEEELILGLSPMVEIFEGHQPRALVFAAARMALDLRSEDDDDAWAALDEGLRTRAVEIALSAMRASAASIAEIRALFEPKVIPEGSIEISAKSADGQPYNRCGVRWGDHFQTEVVDQDAFERLTTDPNIIVRA